LAGLSNGEKAGIGIGVAFAVPFLFFVAFTLSRACFAKRAVAEKPVVEDPPDHESKYAQSIITERNGGYETDTERALSPPMFEMEEGDGFSYHSRWSLMP
jgi:hypothetical protein